VTATVPDTSTRDRRARHLRHRKLWTHPPESVIILWRASCGQWISIDIRGYSGTNPPRSPTGRPRQSGRWHDERPPRRSSPGPGAHAGPALHERLHERPAPLAVAAHVPPLTSRTPAPPCSDAPASLHDVRAKGRAAGVDDEPCKHAEPYPTPQPHPKGTTDEWPHGTERSYRPTRLHRRPGGPGVSAPLFGPITTHCFFARWCDPTVRGLDPHEVHDRQAGPLPRRALRQAPDHH
jgi:hypothetical protein